MRKKKLLKVSILITNFNKGKYIAKALQSALKQIYKNCEIIVYDDNSTDDSLITLKKYKNFKLVINKNKKQKSSPQNQISAIINAFKKSNGKYIFLLDGDDYFKINKVSFIINKFNKNKNLKLIQDFPIKINSKKKFFLKKKFNKNIWPSIIPTSSICVERKYFQYFLKYIQKNKFPNLEIDSRIVIYSFLRRKLSYTSKSLTYYREDTYGISSKYTKFSINWWKKRNEAFDYMHYLMKKLHIKKHSSPDFFITKLINLFI